MTSERNISRLVRIPALFVFLVASAAALPAQVSAPIAATVAVQAEPQTGQAKPPAEGSREAVEKAEQQEKKEVQSAEQQSPAVQWIARKTGLSVENAYLLCIWINFLIVVVVLVVLMRKILPVTFRTRTDSIQKRMEDARRESEDARRRLAGVEERLSKLDSEIAQMRSEAEAAGKAEEERVLKAAEDERRRIVETSEQEIAMAANAAQRELKAFVAGLAVDLAEKKISVSAAADQALVQDFTARLGREQ
jgi:F-type H+-transporting ATPase subunit b